MSARLHHRTRWSASIPLSLLRRGRVLEIPLYFLLRSSDLAREGLDHSGSHRFADHIYCGRPSGRGPFGRALDARLLSLPAVRSFRYRYVAARDELIAFVLAAVRSDSRESIDVLSVPCGIPRELADAALAVRQRLGECPDRVRFHGLDLDAQVLADARRFADDRGFDGLQLHHGDAFNRSAYPPAVDFITCTGLAEFLDDDLLEELYRVFFDRLKPGGRLITSGMQRRGLSDYLLRLAEIRTHYRGPVDLERIVARVPFREVQTRVDDTGIQTILMAAK